MVCQKCGLQPATVHLERHVFRQLIQEHLCELCAGDRASASLSRETAPHKSFDAVEQYLALVARKPPLTPERERVLWKQIESAESHAQTTIFRIPAVARYTADVAKRVLGGRERFARVVAAGKIKRREAYLQALPRLVKDILRQETMLGRAWRKAAEAKTSAERRKLQRRQRASLTTLATSLRKLRFKLKIYEEFLEELRPALEEIDMLAEGQAQEDVAAEKSRPSAAAREVKRRLRRLENIQRMAANDLHAAANKSFAWIETAHRAKAEVVEAHLWQVITIAKNFGNRGLSFFELVMEGNAGLMNAVECFERRGSENFALVATRSITESIMKALLDRPSWPA
jgi:RNA polymerase primary sigma factor